jgi:hypothetical protein
MKPIKKSLASNKFYYRFFRATFLIVALTLFLVAALGVLFPELVIVNDETVTSNGIIVIVCLAVVFLILYFLIRNKFAYVILTGKNVFLINPIKRGRYTWEEVGIKQVPFIFPPLYKITLPDQTTFLFNTENKYVFFSVGIVLDLSEMGELIKSKIKSS